jgi:hypothetical protein
MIELYGNASAPFLTTKKKKMKLTAKSLRESLNLHFERKILVAFWSFRTGISNLFAMIRKELFLSLIGGWNCI